jgi:predicted ATPase/DNA-binding CsgD family transcriptional regulator
MVSVRPPLPLQPTRLIGREAEIAAATARLASPEVRLLTLTGPPGVGKTRLALAVAAEATEAFARGVALVELAPLADPALVPSAIAGALDIREQGVRPLTEQIALAIGGASLLLVLDNVEHLLGAAPVVAELLATCPGLNVLATSRTPLGLRWEHRFPVAPLSAAAARELFAERVRAAAPDVAVTGEAEPHTASILARLDGLPLAIELAAARAAVLPLPSLAERLGHGIDTLGGGARDLPARQQTLRNTIAWSYGLLSPVEQTLLRRMAVFAGGCSLAAIGAICSAAGAASDVLSEVSALVDSSLLRHADHAGPEPRFTMLETVREFAAEQLAATPEADPMRRRHATYYLEVAEALEPLLDTAERDSPLAQLTVEHDNLRSALASAEKTSATDGGELWLRLVGSLGDFWRWRGYLSEGQDWLARALAAGAGGSPATRGRALLAAAQMAWYQGDYATTYAHNDQALLIFRELDDLPHVAKSLMNTATSLAMLGDLNAARARAEESIPIARRAGDPRVLAQALNGLALVTRLQGDLDASRAAGEEGLTVSRATGDPLRIAYALRQLGRTVREQGDHRAARPLLEESLPILQATANPWEFGYTLHELGSVAVWEGDYAQAVVRYSESLRALEGAGLGTLGVLRTLAYVARLQGDLDLAVAHERAAVAQCRGEMETLSLAACLSDLAGIAFARGEPRRAARLFGASEALCEPARLPYVLLPIMRRAREQDVAAVRVALGEEAFAAEWAAGKALPPDLAIAEAFSPYAEDGNQRSQPETASAGLSSTAHRPAFPDHLTAREVEVLRLVAGGKSNAEIAGALVLSVHTVERHVANIFAKLGAHNRAEAAAVAARHGLV